MTTQTKQEHTKTPWEVMKQINGEYVINGGEEYISTPSLANAEFIVQTINSHEELLEAVKLAIHCFVFLDINGLVKQKLSKAITNAEGGTK